VKDKAFVERLEDDIANNFAMPQGLLSIKCLDLGGL
jgi:hypothetical protein